MSRRDRSQRFAEFVRLLDRLRTDDHVSADGHWFATDDARTAPSLRAPMLVAANGPRALALAAQVGDGWVTTGPGESDLDRWFAALAAMNQRIDDLSTPAGFRRVLNPDAAPNTSGASRFALSSADFFAEVVGRAAQMGFTDVVTHWPRAELPYAGSERVLEDVAALLPQLRSLEK